MTNAQKPVVLFDIDKTLFDTSGLFKQRIVPTLTKLLAITKEELAARQERYTQSLEKYTDFEPTSYLQAVSGRDDVSDLAAASLLNEDNFKTSVFADAIPTLKLLAPNYTLGIYSEANFAWQQQKLTLSGLLPFFNPNFIFIWKRKTDLKMLEKIPTGATIIDDNPIVITELLTITGITPIWLNRANDKQYLPVTTITHLSELPDLLKKGTHV